MITRLNVGGPAIEVLLLHERLDRSRFETAIFTGQTSAGEGDIRDLRDSLAAEPPREVRGLRREISPLADLRAFGGLVAGFRAFRPDIVHTNMAKAGLLGRVAARVTGVPVVVHTLHGNVLRGYFDPFRSFAFLMLERMLGRISTTIVTLSPRQTAETSALGIAPAAKLVEIPIGIDLDAFLRTEPGHLRAELGIADDALLVGIVARLVPIKAVHTFIDAAAHLAKARADVRFVVAGDGPLRPELEALAAARGLGDRCVFLGWRADLPSVYADLDVVVLTSRNEGVPITLIEALAAARPVVATAVGGVPDLIADGESGFLVSPESPDETARAIAALLDSAALRIRMGRAGRARVNPAHDSTTLVRNMDRLYERLAVHVRARARP